MLNATEIETLVDALDMALQSNKRMQNSKPKFHEIFKKIETDLLQIRNKLNNMTPVEDNKNVTPVAKK